MCQIEKFIILKRPSVCRMLMLNLKEGFGEIERDGAFVTQKLARQHFNLEVN